MGAGPRILLGRSSAHLVRKEPSPACVSPPGASMTRRLCLAVTTLAGLLAASCHESTPPRFAAAQEGRQPGEVPAKALASTVSFALAPAPLALTASDGT